MNKDRFNFRIWDNRRKRYMGHSPCVELIDETISHLYLDEEDKVIEQCTGVRDKNGNLVFEGDILHFHIELDDGEIIDEDIDVSWFDEDTKFDMWQSADCVPEFAEIIGNIHEESENA